jgi:hypothetical protein
MSIEHCREILAVSVEIAIGGELLGVEMRVLGEIVGFGVRGDLKMIY